ncbi:UDP-glycosyltransferase 92A1-like [Gastrolobium bilobum]|uniref:UDP-glycosyltransferase 92A1-like n=1 Tax=Gastrolobium bilobum TaxID=150636 RepID=UPI002AB2C620|nr:UDP-glycosyltransferase 92A1-like [Gastrolobium bilobum]
MAEAARKEGHIVMAPFMAHGHLIPFLALARQIQERTSFTITIATTHLNIQYLKSAISTTNDIHFAELPFNSSHHGLPPNIENTEKLPLTDIIKLFHASMSLEAPLRSLISQITQEEGHPPLCIISDVFHGWVTNVAKSLGTRNITFTTCGAYGTLAYISMWSNLPHRKTDSDVFCVPGFPQSYRFHRSQLHRYLKLAYGNDDWSRFFIPQIALSMKSDGWICNTVEEVEPLGLQLLRQYLELPVWTVGPLLQPAANKGSSKHRAGKEPGIALEACIEWLNLKDQNSVLYISFGSQNTISASQMMALAEGLEESGKPFIWVIRPPFGFDINGVFGEEWLPEGFEERMRVNERGLLVHKWGPQLEILSHTSTGAFLSHCGWNSVLESLSHGVPIIGWPLAAEQAYNAKMLVEEMGVCVELTRTVESVISREEVKKVIEIVMDHEGKGKEMKEKANDIAVHFREAKREKGEGKGSSVKAMDDFVRHILSSKAL